jgi:S-methylmethionine-dependent homocysteine/selenocysteine methylase
MTFEHLLKNFPVILTEGAIVERLKWEYHVELDENINHAGLVYDAQKPLRTLYSQYIDIAQAYRLPVMLMTPTRRVNAENVRKSKYAGRDVIQDCCAFLLNIRATYLGRSAPIAIGGLMGCRGNAYCAEDALSRQDAYTFHRVQVEQFSGQNLDFLFAGIMPAVSEAIGLADALAETELPYIISFMIRNTGRLLDGVPITDAIAMIDSAVSHRPICYMANCVHPLNVKQALNQSINRNSPYIKRFQGIQANASLQSPEELDMSGVLQQENLEDLILHMRGLHTEFGMKILGGCCGTDNRFHTMLARTYGQRVPLE